MLLRDRLIARLREMGTAVDYQQLAVEVLGIRGAPAPLARRLVEQALVIEDRQAAWRQAGERIVAGAPALPGVYVLRDELGAPLYVGKANNLRRRLGAHFAPSRWKRLPPGLARVAEADWDVIGSEIVALLREATLIAELEPPVNTQVGPPRQRERAVPPSLVRDVIAVVPSADEESADLVAARPGGAWLVQPTRRDGSDLAVHVKRLRRFFASDAPVPPSDAPLAALVYTWLAGRGQSATRLDPHDGSSAALRARLASVLADGRLFHERIDQR